MHFTSKTLSFAAAAVVLAGLASAQPCRNAPQDQNPPQGQCCRRGAGPGQMGQMGPKGPKGMMGADQRQDMALFHYLLDHRQEIVRTVTEIDGGVETRTESDQPEIAAKIREHVRSMYARVEENRPIHLRDPLFAEIFQHADEIQMTMTETDKGILVRETSDDPYVTKLIRAHAEVVNQFLRNGRPEMMQDHPVPER